METNGKSADKAFGSYYLLRQGKNNLGFVGGSGLSNIFLFPLEGSQGIDNKGDPDFKGKDLWVEIAQIVNYQPLKKVEVT